MLVELIGHSLAINDLGDLCGVDVVRRRNEGTCATAIGATVGHLDLSKTVNKIGDCPCVTREVFPTIGVVHVAARQTAHAVAMAKRLETERTIIVVTVIDDGCRLGSFAGD